MGIAGAVLGVAVPILVAEIAHNDIRGTLSVLSQLLLAPGIAVENTPGLTQNRSVLGCVSAAFLFIFFVIFILVPGKPVFLLIKDKSEAAAKSLQWYRGKIYDTRMEIKGLEEAVEEMKIT